MVRRATLLAAAIAIGLTPTANAATLVEAIVEAYRSNPALQSQRYDLKALDEAYVRAYATVRPHGDLQASANYVDSRAGDATQALRLAADPLVGRRLKSNKDDIRLIIEQLLYSGGQAAASIDAASFRVRSGREELRAVEGDIILQVITAYEDVRRDEASLAVWEKNLSVLKTQFDMTEARQVAGEVTRTDVEQANAQLEAAQAQLTNAKAQLEISRAAYLAVVGDVPAALEDEPALPLVPQSLETALSIASDNNPELLQARYNERESASQASQAKSANSVVVSARTTYGLTGEVSPYDIRDQDRDFTFGITLTKPLFSGGANRSGYRAALDRNAADRLRIDDTQRRTTQAIASAWSQLRAAKAGLVTQQRQLKSAEIAAEGMREEFRYGQRSTLDVLVAEQNLTQARLAIISSQRDIYVAEATLLRQVGYLEARTLLVNLAPYDPSENLRAVKSRGSVPWEGIVLSADRSGLDHAKPLPIHTPDGGPLVPAMAQPDLTTNPAVPDADISSDVPWNGS